MSKFARSSKTCEKLEKSQFLLKLIKTSVRRGRRVPSKNYDFCNFCDFSKTCEKLEKSQFLLKLRQVLEEGEENKEYLPWFMVGNLSFFVIVQAQRLTGFCQWGVREILVTLWFNLASSIHCWLILTISYRNSCIHKKNFALKISSLDL